MERVGRGGMVAQKAAVQAVGAAAPARVPTAGRNEAPRVDARADRGGAGTGDDTDL